MPKEPDFNTIHLNTILTEKEIKNLSQTKTFTDIEESNCSYEKDELVLKFISLAIEKFEEMENNSLVKCFEWVKTEFQIHLGIKPKISPLIDLQKTNEEEDKQKLNWFKEYSSLNHADLSFYENLSKNILKYAFKKYITFLRIKRENKEKLKEKNEEYKISNIFKGGSSKLLNISKEIYNISSENFNIFEYEKKIGPANVLRTISIYTINETKLHYLINEKKLINFTNEITSGYHRENPYHTDIHASDMLQTIFLYNKKAKFKSHINCDDLDLLSLFISAIIHDYGHPGLSNNYLINTKNELALTYNDKSVLENFHVSQAFKIMKNNPECDVLDFFSGSDYQMLRKNIITCVLGTDMSSHKKMFQKFNLRLKTFEISEGKNVQNIFKDLDSAGNYKLKLEFLSLIIHTADISNPTKPLDVYKEWANRVANEFFLQGDLEKKNNMAVSFNCDRNTTTVSKIQYGFIDFIVEPLFNMIVEYFPQLDFTVENVQKNKKYYKGVVDKEKKEEEEKNEKIENKEKIEKNEKIENKENLEKKEKIENKEKIEKKEKIENKENKENLEKKEKIENKENLEQKENEEKKEGEKIKKNKEKKEIKEEKENEEEKEEKEEKKEDEEKKESEEKSEDKKESSENEKKVKRTHLKKKGKREKKEKKENKESDENNLNFNLEVDKSKENSAKKKSPKSKKKKPKTEKGLKKLKMSIEETICNSSRSYNDEDTDKRNLSECKGKILTEYDEDANSKSFDADDNNLSSNKKKKKNVKNIYCNTSK